MGIQTVLSALITVLICVIPGTPATAPTLTFVPVPNFRHRIDYGSWYRSILDELPGRNKSTSGLGHHLCDLFSRRTRTGLFDLSSRVRSQVDLLLDSPRFWTQKDFPELARVIRDARPVLEAFGRGGPTMALVPNISKEARSLTCISLPYLPAYRTIADLVLCWALMKDAVVKMNPVRGVRKVIFAASQLQYDEVPIPILQSLVAMRVKERAYEFIRSCYSRNLLGDDAPRRRRDRFPKEVRQQPLF